MGPRAGRATGPRRRPPGQHAGGGPGSRSWLAPGRAVLGPPARPGWLCSRLAAGWPLAARLGPPPGWPLCAAGLAAVLCPGPAVRRPGRCAGRRRRCAPGRWRRCAPGRWRRCAAGPLAPLCGRAWHAPGNLCDHRCGPVARWAGECLAVRSQGRSGAYSDARACTRPGAAGRRCTRLCGPHGAQGPLHGAGRCEALRGRHGRAGGPLRPGLGRCRPGTGGAPGAAVPLCAAGPGDGGCWPGRRGLPAGRYTGACGAYTLHARLSGRRGAWPG